LRGVANRSPLERWEKWRRRRPSRLAQVALLLTVLTGSGLALAYVGREVRQARTALAEGSDHFQRRDYRPARDAWQRGLAMVQHLPLQDKLAEQFRDHLRRVDRAETAQELHHFVESVRVLYGADGQAIANLRAAEARCRTFWEKSDLIAERLRARETDTEGEQVRNDLLELAILWTDLRTRLAAETEQNRVQREALAVLNRAETLFGRSCVLDCERRVRQTALGLSASQGATELAPRTAWEQYAVGRALFRTGKLDEAGALFDLAIAQDPRSLWAHFYNGACAYRCARYDDAVLAFTACTVLAPEQAWCYYNRALAYDAAGQLERALSDCDRALELDPALGPAARNRGMLHYRAGRHARALEDLDRAARSGSLPALVYYDQALVYLARGDRITALERLDKALKLDPRHPEARALAKELRRP
jgi:tetratricopeptide (TPR) repeat protein